MPLLTLFALLLLGGLAIRYLLARARSHQRLAPRFPRRRAPVSPPRADLAPVADVAVDAPPEPVAQVFPVLGLAPGREAAAALQASIRRWEGVVSAYVSSVTAYAYVDYLPAQVTEEQLAQAIQRTGHQVGDPSRRFDWRHTPQRP